MILDWDLHTIASKRSRLGSLTAKWDEVIPVVVLKNRDHEGSHVVASDGIQHRLTWNELYGDRFEFLKAGFIFQNFVPLYLNAYNKTIMYTKMSSSRSYIYLYHYGMMVSSMSPKTSLKW